MADFSASQEHLLKELISGFRCSVCRRTFDRSHIRVAARHEQLWVVSVRCTLCRNQQVFWAAVKDNGEESVLRDVSGREEQHFAQLPPVTADEVLDMHEFLADFDGDFRTLFDK
jgi:hypothetical protein